MIKENKMKVMDNKINIQLKKQFNGKNTNLPKIRENFQGMQKTESRTFLPIHVQDQMGERKQAKIKKGSMKIMDT